MTDIIVSGHICVDLIPDLGAVAPEACGLPGRLTETGPLALATGGAVPNVGLALNKLGVDVGLMASVGDDHLGKTIIALLEGHGRHLSRLISVETGRASSYSVVLAPRGQDRAFLHHAGTNATFGAEQVDQRAVKSAKIFHLGYPPIMPRLLDDSGAPLQTIFAQAKAGGVVTSLDMVTPDPGGASGRVDWRAVLAKVLPHVDIFLPSLDEALFMLRRADFDAWGAEASAEVDRAYLHKLTGELLAQGVVVAGVKLGERGLYLRTAGETACRRLARVPVDQAAWAEREFWQPAYATDVKGTTGAGDCAYAGFLAAILRGLPPQACIQWASAVGACNVEAVDATSGVRTWAATEARLEAGWAARPERLRGY